MNVDSILISEYASTEGALLNVINVFNQAKASGSPPFQVPILAVSLIIHGSSREAGKSHSAEIRLIDQDRELLRKPNQFQWKFAPKNEMNPGMPLRHIHVWRIVGQKFPRPGPYAFEVYINDTYYAASSLFVG